MTWTASVGAAAARSAAVAALSAGMGLPLSALPDICRGRVRSVAWALIVLPYCVPLLLVAYAWSRPELVLIHYPVLREVFYCGVLVLRLTPVAALILRFAPRSIGPEALHCRRLSPGASGKRPGRWGFLVRGRAADCLIAFLAVYVLACGEFEMASRLGAATWTVALFDAHAGGRIGLAHSLRLAVVPMAVQLAALLIALALLFGVPRRWTPGARPRRRLSHAARILCWSYLVLAAALLVAGPLAIVVPQALAGIAALAGRPSLWREIGASLLFGSVAAACAYMVAGWFLRAGRWAIVPAAALCVPAVIGPLVLSLLFVGLFQRPVLRWLYDSPAPLILALTLLLAPLAMVVRLLVHVRSPGAALHAARLLPPWSAARRRLVWHLRTRAGFWTLALLFWWGYFDLTAGAVLAPPALTTATARLYDFMHYGHTAVLSAMVVAFFAVPPVVALAAWAARRAAARWIAPWVRCFGH